MESLDSAPKRGTAERPKAGRGFDMRSQLEPSNFSIRKDLSDMLFKK